MRKKLAAGIVAGAIILGVPGYTIFHSYQANAEEARVLDNATDAVNSLYASKKYNYLADGVSKNDIQKAQKLVSDVADSKKQKSLAEKASNAAIMLEASNAVKEDIVDGVIVDDLTKSILSVTKESVDKVKPISKDLY
ncbi:toxin Cry1Ac domain D-VI-related protein, partial [Bacillus subtilis]